MTGDLARIDAALAHVAHLADELRADPDGHVRRSIQELCAAFATRGAIEPAVARVRRSMELLMTGNHDASRREFQRRANSLDHLGEVVEQELLPNLRRIGFDV